MLFCVQSKKLGFHENENFGHAGGVRYPGQKQQQQTKTNRGKQRSTGNRPLQHNHVKIYRFKNLKSTPQFIPSHVESSF